MLEWQEEFYYAIPEITEIRELLDQHIAEKLREYFKELDKED